MQKRFTRFISTALGLLVLAGVASAQTVYAPVPVMGFTQDVIANGPGAVTSSTTSDMDNGAVGNRFCFVAADFVSPTGATPVNSLALNGIINSLATPGITYKLGSYGANNSLRLTTAGSTGTLTFTIPQSAGSVYLLGASGNGISTFTATVVFTDGTSQVFAGRTLADWFGGASPVIQGVGRVNYDSNALQAGTDPRLYEVPLSLLAANYAKDIQRIDMTKTSTLGALNLMAVSIGVVCPSPPVGGAAAASVARLCSGTSTSLSAPGASAGASLSYQWQASTNGGTTWADIASANAITYTATPTVTTQYRLRATCGNSSGTSTPVTVTVEPRDVAALTYPGSPFCQVSGATAAPVFSPAGGSFSGTPGLVINLSTGVVNLASSTAGAHTVRYTSAGFCPATATAALTLAVAPAATLAYGGSSYCQASADPVPTAAPVGGTFAGTPGLVVNASTGAVSLAQSTPGLHTVTYALAGACAAPASTTLRIEATAAPVFYNIITPNGDTKNDYLAVSLPSVTGYEMQVYNRWGKRVWLSTDPGAHWAAEGNAAGIYYYWVSFTDCSGQSQTHRSWVEVIK
ncbi:MAG: gliding motility-associated C-terminal domain-containing protein [Hymenobacter sp.]|nr:MAG: gliding motility-associated C-terminal domain-containing protein [Hymenobacter sp.]